ncbi:MAG: 4Fe-4S binding protein [Candidatus Ranarchaeia archaeon]
MPAPPEKREIVMDDKGLKATWTNGEYTKTIQIDWNKCNGCNLCVPSCPVEALSLGPIPGIATGAMKAPPLLLDHNKCEFCGICESICPLKAITITHQCSPLSSYIDYPRIAGATRITENCIPCFVCEKVCPTEALELAISVPKKDDLVKYRGKTGPCEGTIIIDKNKCTYCGLCAELCSAITISWAEPGPEQIVPATDITIDISACDYCDLCRKICPSDAIQVTCTSHPPRKIDEARIKGDLKLDEEKCIHCGWCSKVCPVDGIKTIRPFDGKITIEHLERCDPLGCKACINICPTQAWYIPTNPEKRKKTKIAVNEELCVYCGACVQACPEKLILIHRKEPVIQGTISRPWVKQRTHLLTCSVLGKSSSINDSERYIHVQQKENTKKPSSPISVPIQNQKLQKQVLQRLDTISSKLRSVTVRRSIEKNHKKHKGPIKHQASK